MAPLNCAILITPLFGATFMFLQHTIAHFVSKFPNLRCHGNECLFLLNFSDIVKFPDLDKPLIGATCLALMGVASTRQDEATASSCFSSA